jgi:hypothetical protein
MRDRTGAPVAGVAVGLSGDATANEALPQTVEHVVAVGDRREPV